VLAAVVGLVMLGVIQGQCVKPDVTIGDIVCATDTPTPKPDIEPKPTPTNTPLPTDTPEPIETPTPTPTLEPTDTPTAVPSETPTPEATRVPIEVPNPLPPVVVITETPTPRPDRTPLPTPQLPAGQTAVARSKPQLPPGPERARSIECLSAPPAVPDLPGVRDASWTNEQRCGGTPEALATQYVAARPAPLLAPTPDQDVARVVVVVIVSAPTPEPTETPAPERMQISPPASTDEVPPERPEVPVQLPDSE